MSSDSLLVHLVTENARVPVVQHFKGVCHLFVDAGADLESGVTCTPRSAAVQLTARASTPRGSSPSKRIPAGAGRMSSNPGVSSAASGTT